MTVKLNYSIQIGNTIFNYRFLGYPLLTKNVIEN